MRYVSRQLVSIPPILRSDTAELRRQSLRDSAENGSFSQMRARVDHELLKDNSIREGLEKLFQGRCAYCEQRASAKKLSNLEPHRPLGQALGKDGRTDHAYYTWLAYDWDNIVSACDACRRRKQNQFFVDGKRGAMNASVGKLRETEKALFLDPCYDDPGENLRFGTNGHVEALSVAAQETISLLSLNRPELVAARHAAFLTVVDRLTEDPRGCEVVPTGARGRLSAYVFTGTDHPGATAIALLSTSIDSGSRPRRLPDLIDELAQMDDRRRREHLAKLISGEMWDEAPGLEASFALPSAQRLPGLAGMPAARAPLTDVRIRNFKGLRKLEFKLPESLPEGAPSDVPCMILLGENATGKSSVLEAIALALLGTTETAALDGMIPGEAINPGGMIHRPDPTVWHVVSHGPLEIEVGFFESRAKALVAGHGGSSSFDGNPDTSKIVLAYGPRRYFSRQRTRRFRAPAHRVRSLFDPMATIANPSDWLMKCPPAMFAAAVRALKEILMLDPEDFFDRQDGSIVIEASGSRTRLEDLSVGYKSVIAMATDIIRELMHFYDNLEYASATVLIDEIETHLHPRWKMRIMTCLRRAFPKVQFIVTTHDPLCLRGMQDGEIFVLHRRLDGDGIEKLESLPSTKGMRAEQLLTSEFFGLGSTDPETDAKLAVYHHLAARGDDLSPQEEARLKEVSAELDDRLVVGDTPLEQALVSALKEAELQSRTSISLPALPLRTTIFDNAMAFLRGSSTASDLFDGRTSYGTTDAADGNDDGALGG